MPLDIPEILSDLPALLALGQKLRAAVAALPPTTSRKATDYGTVIVALTPDLCTLIDAVEAQVKS